MKLFFSTKTEKSTQLLSYTEINANTQAHSQLYTLLHIHIRAKDSARTKLLLLMLKCRLNRRRKKK